jgi:hypothetical protein
MPETRKIITEYDLGFSAGACNEEPGGSESPDWIDGFTDGTEWRLEKERAERV